MSQPKKILMVAMPTLHFFRWTEQLKDTGFEVYWFDITGSGKYVHRIDWLHQHTDWKMKYDFPGRYTIKKRAFTIYQVIQRMNEHDLSKAFEDYILNVKPDIIHSFALYVACSPIIKVMERHTNIPWVYSSWGSDLFYFQNIPNYLKDIKRVLPRVDYLFADCNRDIEIAKKYGFQGEVLGVVPGGGGFHLKTLKNHVQPLKERRIILVKGFQGRSGRAIQILNAAEKLQHNLKSYSIVVFGASDEVIQFINQSSLKNWGNLQCLKRIPHEEVLKIMGQALIYIGNSNSDGMPNTLLEALSMGAFPIQSNPGGATEDLIVHGENGLLIQDCENVEAIKDLILQAISNPDLLHRARIINKKLRERFDFNIVKEHILTKYLSLVP